MRQRGRYETLAIERQRRDLETGAERGLWFDEAEADRSIEFFETCLTHHKGEWAGQPLILSAWQRDHIMRPLFGWKRADGTRRFRTAFIECPRKQGKTTWAAGVGLYMMLCDGEPGAEVYSVATKQDQARIVHNDAKAMVQASRALKSVATVYRHNIHSTKVLSLFEPLSSESRTMDGYNAHCAITDEVHAHKDRNVYDLMATSMGSRRQPLNLVITTAGLYDPTTIGWELHQYAINVLEGVFDDDAFLAVIYCAEKDDDWRAEATWAKANPGLGISVKWDFMRELALRASRSPAFLNSFLRLHLGVWTEQVDRWLDTAAWAACAHDLKLEDYEGRECYAGLDLAATTDLTSFCLAFPMDGGQFHFFWWHWCPESTIGRRSRDEHVPYDAWHRDGWLDSTPGSVIDLHYVRAAICALGDKFLIKDIAFDPWNATGIANDLMNDGFVMVQFRQGFYSLNEPSKRFEAGLLSGKIRHRDNPLMAWQIRNVAVAEDAAGNIKPSKMRSTERIDGVVAGIMALARATYGLGLNEESFTSVYEERGFIFLGA